MAGSNQFITFSFSLISSLAFFHLFLRVCFGLIQMALTLNYFSLFLPFLLISHNLNSLLWLDISNGVSLFPLSFSVTYCSIITSTFFELCPLISVSYWFLEVSFIFIKYKWINVYFLSFLSNLYDSLILKPTVRGYLCNKHFFQSI